MGGVEDKELEKCEKIDQIIEIIKNRKKDYSIEKENIDIHFENHTDIPSDNVVVLGRKNTLNEIRDTSSKIEKLYTQSIENMSKYKDKIPISKAIKYMKKACNYANERAIADMKEVVDDFTKYCQEL